LMSDYNHTTKIENNYFLAKYPQNIENLNLYLEYY
jgi:hypothetical protein